MPVPVSGISPAAIRACLELGRSARGPAAADPWPCALDLADLRSRSSRICALSSSCCAWSPSAVSTSGDALLGRVADARALRGELGGDEEAEGEQRDAERDLPASGSPGRAARRGHASARPADAGGVSATTATITTTTTTMTTSDDPRHSTGDRSRPVVGAGAPGRARAPGAGATPGSPATRPRPSATGPRGAGCGPCRVGAVGARGRPSQRRVERRRRPCPSAAVNASSSVRPSAYERMSATSASWPCVRTR